MTALTALLQAEVTATQRGWEKEQQGRQQEAEDAGKHCGDHAEGARTGATAVADVEGQATDPEQDDRTDDQGQGGATQEAGEGETDSIARRVCSSVFCRNAAFLANAGLGGAAADPLMSASE